MLLVVEARPSQGRVAEAHSLVDIELAGDWGNVFKPTQRLVQQARYQPISGLGQARFGR